MDQKPLSIGQLSERTGVSTHTLRYYEGLGILPEVERDGSSRHRRYRARHVQWVSFIRRLRSGGMGISEICEYVKALEEGRESSWPRRREILAGHREEVERRIQELSEHLEVLNRKLSRGCDPTLESTEA